ncbi:uncharacterized protein TRIADDRAFT_24631, partial [Trichoplax adhaerens]
RQLYGNDSIINSDINKPTDEESHDGPFCYINVVNKNDMQKCIVENKVDWLVHYSALLSAVGEQNPELAMQVNIDGFQNVIDIARQYRLRIFCPSTIGAFGADSPRNPTPDITIQRPRTIYGVSKVYMELLGEYYHHRFGVDFRSLRYPGIISAGMPGGGTTDYAIEMFYAALRTGKYKCYLRKDSRLPMMYLPDCIRATAEILQAPDETFRMRTYNVTAMSFTPEELAYEIKKYVPHFEISYEPDARQAIADSWPEVFDDSNARRDWGWQHEYDLSAMVAEMITLVKAQTEETDRVATAAAI